MADEDKKLLSEITAGEFIELLNKKVDDGLPSLPVLGPVGPWIKLVHTIGLPWAIIIGGIVWVLPSLNNSIHSAAVSVRTAVDEGASQRHVDVEDLKMAVKPAIEAAVKPIVEASKPATE